jgi:hypothetical protein
MSVELVDEYILASDQLDAFLRRREAEGHLLTNEFLSEAKAMHDRVDSLRMNILTSAQRLGPYEEDEWIDSLLGKMFVLKSPYLIDLYVMLLGVTQESTRPYRVATVFLFSYLLIGRDSSDRFCYVLEEFIDSIADLGIQAVSLPLELICEDASRPDLTVSQQAVVVKALQAMDEMMGLPNAPAAVGRACKHSPHEWIRDVYNSILK